MSIDNKPLTRTKTGDTMNIDKTFQRFLQAWNRHQDLRSHGASIPELAASRQSLDELRWELHRII